MYECVLVVVGELGLSMPVSIVSAVDDGRSSRQARGDGTVKVWDKHAS